MLRFETVPSRIIPGPAAKVVAALLAAAFVPVVLSSAGPAHASCVAPAFGLLWSYPANGATDVPTDADLFFTGTLDGLPTLNGTPLVRIAGDSFDLGVLAPRTAYEVRWASAVVAFTTGDGPQVNPLRPPESDVMVTRNPTDAVRCPLVEVQGCFDTGPPTRVRFDAGLTSVAWLVDVLSCDGSTRTLVWPSACGAPVLEREDRIVCASLRSSNGAGLSDSTDPLCSAPDVPPESLPVQSSCRLPWPPLDLQTLRAADDATLGSDDEPVDNRQDGADEGMGCSLSTALPHDRGLPRWLAPALMLALSARLWQRTRRRATSR